MYKYEVAGLDYIKTMFNDGKSLVPVYEKFYGTFKPVWFHLHIGTPKYFNGVRVIIENGKEYILFQDRYSDLRG